MKRLPNLDILRFLLATLVVFFHLPQICRNQGLPYFLDAPIFNRGVEAVYMFFVLSGFLIIKTIYSAKQRDVFSIRKFYIRRVLRIFPLYYLVVIFGFVFYWIVLPKLEIPFDNNYQLIDGILLSVFFLPNVFTRLYMPGGILEVLWSIGIEEQFYILVAPILFLVNKNRVLQFLIGLTILYFLIFHLNVISFLKTFNMVFFFLFFGGIVAVLEEKKQLQFLKKNKIYPFIIVVCILLFFLTDIFHSTDTYIFHIIIMVLFGLFIHTIACNNVGIQIRNKSLNYLGQISYGIYMYHVIALNAVVFLFLKLQKAIILIDWLTIVLIYMLTFTFTFIMAHLSYKYFETYFLKLKNKFRE